MDKQFSKSRTSGSWQAIIGATACAFLLGALIVGYFTWDDAPAFLGGDQTEEVAATEAKAALADAAETLSGAAEGDAEAEEGVEEAAVVVTEAVERVEDQQGGLDQRLAAAEQRLARLDLQAQAASGNAGRAEGLLIAFAARRTLERGEQLGYLADQLKLRFGMAQAEAVRTVIEASSNPIRLDQLIAQFEGLQNDLTASEEGPSLDRFRREISNLFVIRRESTPSTRPDRALARARLSLQNGRIQSAIDEVNTLPGAAKAEDWIADARRYIRIQSALDILETSAVLETSGLRDRTGAPIEQGSPADASGEE